MNNSKYFCRCIEFDHIELLSDRKSLDDPEPGVCIFQKYNSDESGIVWDSALLCAKYIEHQIYLKNLSLNNCNIIELGAGTGFLGIWLAAFGASVLITDLEKNLELIQMNVRKNLRFYDDKQIVIKPFDWFDKSKYDINFLQWKPLDKIDYVIISDCLYYGKGMLAIYDFIEWILLSSKSKIGTKVLLSYEDRDDKIEICQDFLKKLEQTNRLKHEFISDEQLHPDYHSNDLHILRIWS